MCVEVKTDSVHIKPVHSFQTKAQAAVNTNPNSPQKWKSFCTLTWKRSPDLKGGSNETGRQPIQRALHSKELFLHSWLQGYKNVSRALCLYWVNGRAVEKTFRLSLDQWFSKGGTCASSVSAACEQVGNAQAPAWSQKFWGWSPAICILISPPGTACSSLRPLLYPAWNSKVLKQDRLQNRHLCVTSALCWNLCNLPPLFPLLSQ